MIEKQEILIVAQKTGLEPSTVEKDYVLGWVLKGIYSHPQIQNSWVFKGGTSLKKCYFENYRFSEDLDFSLLDNSVTVPQLQQILLEVAHWVYKQSGIEIPPSKINIEVYQNLIGLDMLQAKLTYNGPLKRKTNFPRVKIDLSLHERIVLPPENRPIYHAYSDASDHPDIQALCYPFEEIFAEKIRALAERGRPRDVYDVIHLYKFRDNLKSKQLLVHILEEKCKFKGISIPHSQSIDERLSSPIISSEWNRMLAHQLPHLAPFEEYRTVIPTIFDWLYDGNDTEQTAKNISTDQHSE